MFQSMQAPLLFGLVAAFVTMVGLLAVAIRADWSERHSGLFALAAGGMLVSVTLLHIAPHAFEESHLAPQLMLAGFVGGLLLNRSIHAIFREGDAALRAAAFTPIAAIAIHSFVDGIIYAVTFAASFSSGVYASLSLILHEFPEGVIAFAILRRHGFAAWLAFLWAFLAAAVTTPLGVLLASPLVYGLGADVIGGLFAISAGLLLYVATGPLMEPLTDQPPVRSVLALGIGILLAVCLALMPVHRHGDNTQDGHDHDHGGEAHLPFSVGPEFD